MATFGLDNRLLMVLRPQIDTPDHGSTISPLDGDFFAQLRIDEPVDH